MTRHRLIEPPIADKSLCQAHRNDGRLSQETAQRTVRFWQLHDRIEKRKPHCAAVQESG